MINKVILMGRLTRDPEMRHTNSGTPVTTFSIAIDNGYGDNKRTDFVNCLAWNKTAEFVTKYFTKGIANEVNFGESKTSPQLNTPQTAAQPPMQDDDDDFTPLDEDDDLPF